MCELHAINPPPNADNLPAGGEEVDPQAIGGDIQQDDRGTPSINGQNEIALPSVDEHITRIKGVRLWGWHKE